ncbi:MAG: monovalent cation/H(+) antiporter subunit G [Acidimicrobiales bacterium]
MRDLVAGTAMVAGASLAVVAAVGVLRFGGFFARLHAATKPATLGLVLVAAGAALVLRDLSDTARLALVVGFQFLTVPVGTHLVARAAYHASAVDAEALAVDELGDVEGSGERRPPSGGD